VATAVATGRLRLPPGMPLARAVQAMYVTPQMPWVDPAKEATAWQTLLGSGLASGPEVVRKRGRSPTDVQREEMQWRRQWREADESLSYLTPAAAAPEPEPDDEEPGGPPHLDEDDEEANASRPPRRSLHAVR
jgi:capsid protein